MTAIFLPLQFVAGLFGMNSEICNATVAVWGAYCISAVDLPDLHGPGAGARLVVLGRITAVSSARHRAAWQFYICGALDDLTQQQQQHRGGQVDSSHDMGAAREAAPLLAGPDVRLRRRVAARDAP